MCLQDLQLGNNIRSVPKIVAVTTQPFVLLRPNPARIAVFLSSGNNQFITVAVGAAATATDGFQVMNSLDPVFFTMQEYGDLTTKQFNAFPQATPLNIYVIEFILTQEAFQRPLEAIVKDMTWQNTGHRSSERTSHGSRQPTRS